METLFFPLYVNVSFCAKITTVLTWSLPQNLMQPFPFPKDATEKKND